MIFCSNTASYLLYAHTQHASRKLFYVLYHPRRWIEKCTHKNDKSSDFTINFHSVMGVIIHFLILINVIEYTHFNRSLYITNSLLVPNWIKHFYIQREIVYF